MENRKYGNQLPLLYVVLISAKTTCYREFLGKVSFIPVLAEQVLFLAESFYNGQFCLENLQFHRLLLITAHWLKLWKCYLVFRKKK